MQITLVVSIYYKKSLNTAAARVQGCIQEQTMAYGWQGLDKGHGLILSELPNPKYIGFLSPLAV
jgi:hypothetical protein